jgi:hypothetical protein
MKSRRRNPRAVSDLWHWFRRNEAALYETPDADALIREIDARLDDVHPRLGWELGPTEGREMFFAVSPSLDPELLPVAREVVAGAYQSDLWQFVVGRQRRPWDIMLEIQWDAVLGLPGEMLSLKDWKFATRGGARGRKSTIVFLAPSATSMDPEQRREAAEIVAQGLLGEIVLLEQVKSVELVARLPAGIGAKAKPASELPAALGLKPL